MITLKEEFVGGPKIMRAIERVGWEALGMWLALKRYAAENPENEGFIPDEEIERLTGAPPKPRKLLQALIECGKVGRGGVRGSGLVDQAEHGWELHDYSDHANTVEEELRREKARERKRLWRANKQLELDALRTGQSRGTGRDGHAGQRGTSDGTVPGTTAGQATGQSRGTDAVTSPVGGPAPVRTHAGTLPSPAQPSPAQPALVPESAPSGAPLAKPAPRRWRRVPADWKPKPEHVGLAMQLGVNLEAEAVKFRDHEFRDPKSDADACFRTWLRRSIELNRQAIVLRQGGNRAGDLLGQQLARANALEELESGIQPVAPIVLPTPARRALP